MPRTYTVESSDGRYVFVMLAPHALDLERRFWIEEVHEEIEAIRETYERSGLYRVDDPTSPLWTVDWYAHRVWVFSDGIHLVREGPWASSAQDEGVSFFANGELLRTYSVADLVFAPWAMPHSVSHFMWRAETSIDEDALTYRIRTLHHEELDFDVRTGRRVRALSPPNLLFMGVLLAALTVFGVRRARRRRRRREEM